MNKFPNLMESISPGKVKNILLVKQHNQFGDMLCTLPSFAAVRKKYPDAHITLVCSPGNYEILEGENKYIDEFLIYDKSGLFKLIKFFIRLREKNYDISVVPSTVAFSRTSHIIGRLSGAKVRAGVKSADGKGNKSENLLNVKKDFKWEDNKIHQSERFLDIVRQIGCDLTIEEKKDVRIEYTSEEKILADEFFRKYFTDESRRVVSFQPGAGKVPNRWCPEKFENLIEKLYKEFNIYILFTPGPADKDLADHLSQRLNAKNIYSVTAQFNIRIVSLLLSGCSLYITNDTGTMHSAAYSGAKVISLFGPTNGWEWAPEKDSCIFIQSKSNDINDISVEEVYEKAENILKKKITNKQT